MSDTPSGDPPPGIPPSESAGIDATGSAAKDAADAAGSNLGGGVGIGTEPIQGGGGAEKEPGAAPGMHVDVGDAPPSAPPAATAGMDDGSGGAAYGGTAPADTTGEGAKIDGANPAGDEGGDKNNGDDDADPSKYRRTRSSSFDVREESGGSKADTDAASDRGDRVSVSGAEPTRIASSRGQGREDFGALSALVDAGSEIAMRSTASGGPGGAFSAKEGVGGVAAGLSFLDSLSEEERRVRTRHVPSVEGFRALHRSEVRRDLALARSIMNASGGGITKMSATKAAKGRRSSGLDDNGNEYDESRMDVDDEDGTGTGVSDDDLMSEVSSAGGVKGSSKSSRSDGAATGPSPAFVPPLETATTALGATDSADQGYGPTGQNQAPRYPHVIESITAFNPPRPPESIGPKKKHRLLRWERTPQDVEVDLNNYRKTVQRTREELHNAEHDRERIEFAGGHLRSHFLSHLRALREESVLLNQELNSVQSDCVKQADLLMSKTRSFDGGNGTKVMMEVLTVLKSRCTTSAGGGEPQTDTASKPWCLGGVGGVTAEPTAEDGGSSSPPFLANGWILPGDKVSTPDGSGTVINVSGPSVVDADEAPKEDVFSKKPKPTPQKANETSSSPTAAQRHGFGGADAQPVPSSSTAPADGTEGVKTSDAASQPAAKSGEGGVASDKSGPGGEEAAKPPKAGSPAKEVTKANAERPSAAKKAGVCLLPPRVCVRMSYGEAFFSPDSVKSLENPSSYSDEKLALRWRKIVETAKLMGSCVDLLGMDKAAGTIVARSLSISSSGVAAEEANGEGEANKGEAMDVDVEGAGGDTSDAGQPDENEAKDFEEYGKPTKEKMETNRALPIGSGMLLTPGLGGCSLADIPTDKLESSLDPMLFDGAGILGRNDNPGVPSDVKQWEDIRGEMHTLKGRAMQLRNELYRQRRIRMLNERTRHVGQERAERVEGLLAEMKADLTSCKERLKQELAELGIDQDRAADLLATFMKEQENTPRNDVFVPKKRTKTEPKAESNTPPRISRRRGGPQTNNDEALAAALQDADSSDMNAADASERDEDSNPRRKRGRVDVDSLEGSKPKRGGYRRQ